MVVNVTGEGFAMTKVTLPDKKKKAFGYSSVGTKAVEESSLEEPK